MPTFGYQSLYSNYLNSNTQLRRSTDMVYQRGGTYEVVLTGDTYISSMTLDVDLFSDDQQVGRMTVVPYSINQTGSTYVYNFNIRPYDYLSNYVKSQHYTNYWSGDWASTNDLININNPYPNSILANFNYGYKYISGNTTVYENASTPGNPLYHYTFIPTCVSNTSFQPSGTTNTGLHFNYVGGAFQMNEKFILPNFDQEIGTVIDNGLTISPSSLYRRLSPMSQFLMDYPTVPEQSQTARFLTDAPRIQYVQSDDNYVLYFLNGQTGDRQVIEADYVVFEFYDASNTRIYYGEDQINLSGTTYASPTGFTDTLQPFALPCGPTDITNIFSNSINWDAVSYYTIQLCYSYPTNNVNRIPTGPIGPISEVFYFYLYNNCLPENTRIVWLNNRGGYDYFTFHSYRQDTNKIKAQSYDSRYFATDLASPDRDWGRSVKTFATDLDQEIVLESDYLNLSTAHWVEQLFHSPQVYIMSKDFISPIDVQDKYYKDLTPVQVLSTEVETVTEKHKKLNKYRITLKSANTFFVNRGF